MTLAGLFGAAPSVALATLELAIAKEGRLYVSTECSSMIAGAMALGAYSLLVSRLIMTRRLSALRATLLAIPLWFLIASGFVANVFAVSMPVELDPSGFESNQVV